MISGDLKKEIERFFERKFEKRLEISGASSLSGGCINKCYKLKTTKDSFFIKINNLSLFPGMFEAEAKGLNLLKSVGTLHIPEVIFCGNSGEQSFLILEFIEAGARQDNFFEEFGKRLAQMHKNSADLFGLDHDNYIGSLRQMNRQQKSWAQFFSEERLGKQITLAKSKGAIDNETIKQFEHLFVHLEEIFPVEKPSLLHGDLWSGNFLADATGNACLIDPAVYYGHREMDIAMTKLFGGFSTEFYESYQFHFPMEKGWEERVDICNLYPLMVHVNLFGGSYLYDVKSILQRYA